MQLTIKKGFAIASLLILPLCGNAAIDLGNTIRSNLNNNFTYGDFGYRSGFVSPVFFRNNTDSYSQTVINNAGTEIWNAFSIVFTNEVGDWWNPPFENRVAVIEMDTGTTWMAFAGAYIVDDVTGNSTSCTITSWTGVNVTTGDLIGLTTNGTMSGACNGQAVNAGLIIMNTNQYTQLYGTGGTPPDRQKQHLLLHEFGHLSGIGHVTPRQCTSVMIQSMYILNSTTGVPTTTFACRTATGADDTPITYGPDDREMMQFKGF